MINRGICIPNSAGLVTSTAVATGDLVHTLSNQGLRVMAKITKIMWYSAVNATMIIGTWDNAVPVAAFVALFPTIRCIAGQHDFLTEKQLPDVEFALDNTATPNGRSGNIYVLTSVAGVIVRATIKEIR